jgi:hypothetical protein
VGEIVGYTWEQLAALVDFGTVSPEIARKLTVGNERRNGVAFQHNS